MKMAPASGSESTRDAEEDDLLASRQGVDRDLLQCVGSIKVIKSTVGQAISYCNGSHGSFKL